MTLESLFVVLFFLLFLLSGVVRPWLRRRRGGTGLDQPEGEEPDLSTADLEQEGPPLPIGAPQASAAPHRPRDRPASVPPAQTASPRPELRSLRSQLGDLREVRRGIVLMTVLGPCRALDESDPSSSERPEAPVRSRA